MIYRGEWKIPSERNIAVSPSGKAVDFGSTIQRFKSSNRNQSRTSVLQCAHFLTARKDERYANVNPCRMSMRYIG